MALECAVGVASGAVFCAAGTVCACCAVRFDEKTKSFHAVKNAMIAVVKTPGAASGAMTFTNACQLEAPSTCAACSISHGICWKNADSVQIDNGSVSVR